VPACDVRTSSDIKYNQHQAYPGVDSCSGLRALASVWDPRGNGKTVISGGAGLFYDTRRLALVDNLLGTLGIRFLKNTEALTQSPAWCRSIRTELGHMAAVGNMRLNHQQKVLTNQASTAPRS